EIQIRSISTQRIRTSTKKRPKSQVTGLWSKSILPCAPPPRLHPLTRPPHRRRRRQLLFSRQHLHRPINVNRNKSAMKLRCLILAGSVLILLRPAPPHHPQPPTTLRGQLSRNGDPAPGVQVKLGNQAVGRSWPEVKEKDGMYYFYNIPLIGRAHVRTPAPV